MSWWLELIEAIVIYIFFPWDDGIILWISWVMFILKGLWLWLWIFRVNEWETVEFSFLWEKTSEPYGHW